MERVKKVLVVEDDADDFEILRDLFRRHRTDSEEIFYLERVESYDDAIRRLRIEDWHFLIVDYRLSAFGAGRTGLDLIKEIHAAGTALPAVLVSGMEQLTFDRETIDLVRTRQLRFVSKHELSWENMTHAIGDLLERETRVLIVDDDRDDTDLIVGYLSQVPHVRFDIDVALSLQSARDKVRARSYDAILLDYYLGPECGTELLPDLDECNRDAIVTLCTGYRELEIGYHALQLLIERKLRFITKDQLNGNSLTRILLNMDISGRRQIDIDLPNRFHCSGCAYYLEHHPDTPYSSPRPKLS